MTGVRAGVTPYIAFGNPVPATARVAVLAVVVYRTRDRATRRARTADAPYRETGEPTEAPRNPETAGPAATPPDTTRPPTAEAADTSGPVEPETGKLREHFPGAAPRTKRLPESPPNPRITGRAAAVTAGAVLLACATVVSTVYVTRDDNGLDGVSAFGTPSPSATPVRFTSIPDICGNLSDKSFLDTLIDYRRPADSKTTDTERECGWTTESSAPSGIVDSHLMITAHKFATTESAESSMRKQRDLGTGFDGSKMSELGKPGEFGDEAIIEVYEQDDEKTHGGETYLSINITTITFRAGNLRVHLVYSRSRDADGEPGDTSYTRRGAVLAARSAASSLND
ncbi:hypothetical protein ABZ686_12145 [Streptomyces sp. NPDC006992]|uniref:hypothetical protein n=1 Tax=Streptomyces sp. NPDC006992 TaxID=3155601 RepID=UPI0033DA6415